MSMPGLFNVGVGADRAPEPKDGDGFTHRGFDTARSLREDCSMTRLSIFLVLWCGALQLSQGQVPDTRAPGHSWHGETFSEGPRQRAYLMAGMPQISFPITTRHPEAQRFFNQGIGQLHGFWYFEAERSFREASLLDTNAPMPYWGMAMANANNAVRARGFLTNAVALKNAGSNKERLFIEALADFHLEERDGKKREMRQRRRDLIRAYENIVTEYPEDLEAKALLVHQIWDNSGFGNNSDLAISSHLAVDTLAKEILARSPLHPVHHYRIHLWDPEKPANALNSAALCGSGSPGIAHLWHMPGHTYAKLSRHDDAAWQQEASARVDHAYMIRDRVLPDQIHNYAHNNDWLVESYSFVGRVKDAVELAKNMVELPRLMRTNAAKATNPKAYAYDLSRGSWGMGRNRLLTLLPKFELWDELLALSETAYLEATEIPDEQARRSRALGTALFAKGRIEEAKAQLESMEPALAAIREERQAAVDFAEAQARKEKKNAEQIQKAMADALQAFASRIEKMESFRAELRALEALAAKDTNELGKQLELAKDIPKTRLAMIHWQAGDTAKAEMVAREAAVAATNQVLETLVFADLLVKAGKESEARTELKKLGEMHAAIDPDLPVVRRLESLSRSMGMDWSKAPARRPDFGKRPELATLGPLHWSPPSAPAWSLEDSKGRKRSSAEYRGRPVLMMFFLGRGCAHCMEQLNTFAEVADQFEKAGIALVAVSTDSVAGIKETSAKASGRFPFPLLSDPGLEAFKAFRAHDGFERTSLHGTFLIDGQGAIRWQDIGFEPFLEAPFLLAESKRLLRFGGGSKTVAATKPKPGMRPRSVGAR